MRYQIAMVVGLLITMSACGRRDASELASVETSPREYWEAIAPTCSGYPAKADCDDGDMALFSGLLCASGDARGCAQVRNAQGSDGRWWRSPRRNPDNLGEAHSFSRDMSMGVLLYLAATRDADAARRWLSWIEDNRPCLLWKPFGGGCQVRGPHRFCTDDSGGSCNVTPGNWGLMGRVFQHLGLPRNDQMRLYDNADGELLWLEAQNAPLGYETHLPAVEVLLKQKLDSSRDNAEKAARILVDRQPDNPFFVYLKDGPTAAVRRRLFDLCPSFEAPSLGSRHQWAWERDTADQAWRDSAGWDCLFLANLVAD